MRNNIKAFITLLLSGSLLTSCDYLDVMPAEVVTEDKIYNDITLAQQDLGSLYHDVIKWTYQNSDSRILRDGPYSWTGCCGDEMIDHWGVTAPTTYFKLGGLTTSYNPIADWSWNYALIRKATNFINKIDDVPLTQSQQTSYGTKKKQFKEEARFLRAYLYFDLLRSYGAVPLITDLQDIADPVAAQTPRTPVGEIVDYICTQLDEAAAGLPDTWSDDTNYGRISKAACLALKARTLLYAASPQYNGNTMYKDIKNEDGTQLFPQTYDKELWKKAADAADAAISCCLGAGIKLSEEGENSINKYEKMFYSNTSNPEFILASIQTYGIYEDVSCNSHADDKGGWGRFSIMQNQVDAYETADGYMPYKMDDDGCIIYDSNGQPTITDEAAAHGFKETGFTHVDQLWDGTSWQPCTNIYDYDGTEIYDMGEYDLYNMYVNRDPRFYASLTFQGAKFRNETESNRRCYHFAYWRNMEYYTYRWVDGYPNVNTNNETGYGLRKYMNPTADIKNWIGTSSNYPLFRLSELYLIKAEALNEYLDQPNSEVYDAINKVRSRVDMPSLPITSEDNTKIGMRKRIRNERRVELFFEGHRYWDVRRWLVGDKCFGIPNYRMNSQPTDDEILSKARELGYTSLTDGASDPDQWWDRVWQSRDAGLQIYYKRTVDVKCVWSDKMYLFPIPQDDINKNLHLVQNYGW